MYTPDFPSKPKKNKLECIKHNPLPYFRFFHILYNLRKCHKKEKRGLGGGGGGGGGKQLETRD